ncbi:hypothetical protein OHA70_31985 [Kribbella sp. NBC_00382]|uniref:hypothetical protein n=1 Tax=Kribbella sp. NBC_00382 TaxID=2975967 RepID=UPI002E23D4AE
MAAVENEIVDYQDAALGRLLEVNGKRLVIKYVASRWAVPYTAPGLLLKVSQAPALTWGTGTYVSPICHPLSTALYGRCGLVARADDAPSWRIFDARKHSAQAAYINWARAQPIFNDVLLTVHSGYTNHVLRNAFRRRFRIDCVLFRPDQAAESHTDVLNDTWLLVTDWDNDEIDPTFSRRLLDARFTVLVDEEFDLADQGGLPTRAADRKLEAATLARTSNRGIHVGQARTNLRALAGDIATEYGRDGFVHVWIAP